jgi:hypothetical protein
MEEKLTMVAKLRDHALYFVLGWLIGAGLFEPFIASLTI